MQISTSGGRSESEAKALIEELQRHKASTPKEK
jgi:hypothetical protein